MCGPRATQDNGLPNRPVVAVAGFKFLQSLARGHMMYIDDFATDATLRSKGYGSTLMDW